MKNYLRKIGVKSQKALKQQVSEKIKNKVLYKFEKILRKNEKLILKENKKDQDKAKKVGIKLHMLKRLELDKKKFFQILSTIKKIRKMKDPTYKVLEKWKRPNGLTIKKVTIPLGVIAVIYESRPNVTVDVSCLCFKAGNSVILKGGKESFYTNKLISSLFKKSLKNYKVDENYVQFIENKNRKIVDNILSNMTKYVDVIIPRGGKNLVKKVNKFSKIPVIGHLEGICHTYVDKDADLKKSISIIQNAKLRNPSICGATETILIHKNILGKFVNPILKNLEKHGCKIFADKKILKVFNGQAILAKERNWSKEYLDKQISVKSVDNISDAIFHINKYGTMHTDAIITKNYLDAQFFLRNVKSSIAIHNSSTQFADGGELGFGGEVGISTNKLPPRGPVGLNQLVSYKYEILGKGQIRK